ncbi:MAG: ParB/RepB/Spo0J family partition protein, partial [Eubacterium sp.]|nr:ParB/RepB/Spo0J family partition protein [Eubacterium sp.]
MQLTTYDELLGISEIDNTGMDKVIEVPLEELFPFKNHPFHVLDDEKMDETVESIRSYGVLNPALVRPRAEGGYELVAGHRRKRACEIAGLETISAEIKELSRDEAIILMVESNLQRSVILPSEKAFSYKMRLEAMKRQGQRTDLTSRPVGDKLDERRSGEILGETVGESERQ